MINWLRRHAAVTAILFALGVGAAYATIDNLGQLSKTAASNSDIDSVDISEGMAPSGVNDAIRSLAALIAEHLDNMNGVTTAGTSTAYTLTTNSSFGALSDIDFLVVDFHTANTDTAPTIAVDGLAATAITDKDGGAPAVGTIDGYNILIYDGTDFQVVGDISVASGFLANLVEDTTPQLGGDLDLNGNVITDVVVSDTTPQLGGQLDVNGAAIGDGTNELVTFTEDASAVNQVNIENEATGGGPIISAAGDDTNVALNLQSKAAGNVVIEPNTGDVSLADDIVLIEDDVVHAGDTDNLISLDADTQSYETGGSSRLDLSNSGVRMGGANARVTTILDEDAMGSDSATALATQQSIKAYIDSGGATLTTGTGSITGTTATVSGIPAGTQEIYLWAWNVDGSSANDEFILRIGDSGGLETTGYSSTGVAFTSSPANNSFSTTTDAVFRAHLTVGGTSTLFAHLVHQGSNVWTYAGHAGHTNGGTADGFRVFSGVKTLSGELDRWALVAEGAAFGTAGTLYYSYR